MKSEGHLEIYRVAFASASAELSDISLEIEKLRIRKEQVERLVLALKPLLGEEEREAPQAPDEQAPEHAHHSAESTGEVRGEPAGVGSDPFQRRIDHVLGIGAGIRDVRSYTRQF